MFSTARLPARLIALLGISLLIGGCGWHLRGLDPAARVDEEPTPPPETKIEFAIPALRVESESVDYQFSEAFTDFAIDVGINITAEDSDAPRFILLTTKIEREAATLNEGGFATSFVLHYDVTFELRDADGRLLLRRETLSASRDLEINEEDLDPEIDILAQDPELIEEESAIFNAEMEAELSQQILQKIEDALKPKPGASEESADEVDEADPTDETDQTDQADETDQPDQTDQTDS